MTDYDQREALGILANARARKYSDDFRADRKKAANELREAVRETVEKAGFKTETKQEEDNRFKIMGIGSARVWVASSDEGVRVGSEDPHAAGGGPVFQPPLEYDAVSKRWVGTEKETYATPKPGEPLARRSAVAVVADAIFEALKNIR